MFNPIEQFRDAIRAAGIVPPERIKADGAIHRFPSNGKLGDDAGWYLLHGDSIPAGSFGDWRSGLFQNWRADIGRTLTPAEEAQHRAKAEAMKRKREAEETKRKEEAKANAAVIWQKAELLPTDHPYLAEKNIKPNGARLYKDMLVIPMRADGELQSLQFIGPDGDKRFLTGGRVMGCHFSIGNPTGVNAVCIAEGFATGASIHEATGYPVAVAFNGGNLEAVAKVLRANFPGLPLILCADDDYETPGNPGLTKAIEAARAVAGLLAIPDFGSDRPEGVTDFNDMAALNGVDAVKQAIASASEPETAKASPEPENAPAGEHAILKSDAEMIAWLAAMKPLEYERVRIAQARLMKCRPAVLDAQVKSARHEGSEAGRLPFPEIEPHPDPIDPAQLLDEVSDTIRRYIVLDIEQVHAAALWVAFTWFIDVVNVAPLAIINAPEKACGKSQLLDLLGRMAARPLPAANSSTAGLFRAVELWKPTVLIDEADTFIRENEELKGLINAGHTRSNAFVLRVVGDKHEPKLFNVWGAKAFAGITLEKHLPDATMSRAIVLELRRKLPHESVSRLRHADADLFAGIVSKLARFADDYSQQVRLSRPDLPDVLGDRAQDNWEPLLAIAGCAGAEWVKRATEAALKLSGAGEKSVSTGNELLADIQDVFESKNITRISTADLIAALVADDEKSWATYNRGREISARQIASRLAGYGIKSKTIRLKYETAKGFEASQFEDAFARYLADPPNLPPHRNSSVEASNGAGFDVTENVTCYGAISNTGDDVTDKKVTGNRKVTPKTASILDCDVVTDKKGGIGALPQSPAPEPSRLRI